MWFSWPELQERYEVRDYIGLLKESNQFEAGYFLRGSCLVDFCLLPPPGAVAAQAVWYVIYSYITYLSIGTGWR